MRRFTFALVLWVVPLAALADRNDDDPGEAPAVVDRGDIADQLSNVDQLVSDAIGAIGRARGKLEAVKTLRRAREQLDALRDQVNGAPNPREWWQSQREPNRWFDPSAQRQGHPPRPPGSDAGQPVAAPVPGPPAIAAISEASLAQLLSAIDQQPTSLGRLRVVQQAAPANYFLVSQVQALLGRFTFAPDQIQAARLLRTRLLDRENEPQLNGFFQAPPGNTSGALVERTSFAAKASVRLQPGLYRGNFTLSGSSITVEGAGRDQTIIDGNLVVTSAFNKVKGLTVLGKVIIEGSQNQLTDVDYRAGIEDRGLLNKY
jgi:hypothetical protein